MPDVPVSNRQGVVDAISRVQACVDQLVGQDVFIESKVLPELGFDPLAVRKKVLGLLQRELDYLAQESGLWSPIGVVRASEWLLRELRG